MDKRAPSKAHSDGARRCYWVRLNSARQIAYHDNEWGKPVHDDKLHFEMLCLGVAQCGLSWDLILRRREAYRTVFYGFNAERCAALTDNQLNEIVAGAPGGVIRNRAKVYAIRTNATTFLDIQREFGSFDAYVWGFVQGRTIFMTIGQHQTESQISRTLATDLKRRGMSFVGPVTVFAYLEAAGLYNCHSVDCCFWKTGPYSFIGERPQSTSLSPSSSTGDQQQV